MNAAWFSLCGLGLLGIWLLRDAITEMCKEEIRTRVGRFPYVLLRVVAMRIERALREEALHEWRIELDFILSDTDGLPVTRLLRGIHFSVSLLVHTLLPCARIRELIAAYWWRASSRGLSRTAVMGSYVRLVVVIDGLSALASGQFAFLASFGASGKPVVAYLAVSAGLPLIWISGVALAGGYHNGVAGSGLNECRRILRAGLSLTGGVAILTSMINTDASRSYLLLIALSITTVMDVAARFILSKSLRPLWIASRDSLRVVVVGPEKAVADLIAELRRERYHGVTVVAVCLSLPSVRREISRAPVYGGLDDITAAVRFFAADTVAALDCPEVDGGRLHALAEELRNTSTALCVSPALLYRLGPDAPPDITRYLEHLQLAGFRLVIKNLFDRCLAAVVLSLFAPMFAAIAMTIWLSSGGSPLVTQVMVGKNGREFRIYKFRITVVDAEHHLWGLPIIERLPQLVNVVLGHMSLVGPRPVLPGKAVKYAGHIRPLLAVKPGLTGLWQVIGRSEISWDELARLDARYISNWSFAIDLQILWKTGSVLLRRSSAY